MSSKRPSLLAWIALFTIYIVWGSTYLAIRYVVREVPSRTPAALRFFVAGAVMCGIAWAFDRAWPSRRQVLDYAFVGILLLGVSNGLVMWSEQHVQSGIAALVVATVPLWTTLGDGLRPGGSPWTGRIWLGTVLGLAGVAIVARPHGVPERGHLLGIGALLVASVSWTIGSLYAQTVPKKLPVFSAAAIEMLAGGAFLALQAVVFREDWHRLMNASRDVWLGLLYLAIFGSLVGFTAFAYCLNHLPATTVGTYAYVNPVVAVLLGHVFMNEPLSPGLVTGGALILTAVVLTTWRSRVPPSLSEAEEPAA